MSGPVDEAKDAAAARALSRLVAPPIPEGLAARIKANATALPQSAEGAARTAAPMPDPAQPVAPRARRWLPYAAAASVAAAGLISAALLGGGTVVEPRTPQIAEQAPTTPAPQAPAAATPVAAERPAPQGPVLADARPEPDTTPAVAPKTAPSKSPTAAPAAPVELARDDPDRAAPSPPQPDKGAEETKMAEAGPQLPEDTNTITGAVYGPPAPSGLGIAGSGGRGALPPGTASPGGHPGGPPGGGPR